MKTEKHLSVYNQITERIVNMLEKGTVPWRRPWKVSAGLPRNLLTKKPYRGINVLLLHALRYESPYWLTFRQALELGGNVRKGEKACPVVFWKPLEIEDKTTGEKEKIPLLRYYYVFNLAQCDGLKTIFHSTDTPFETAAKPDAIISLMPQPPEVKHGMRQACYSPRTDTVLMPNRKSFETEAGYHATLFHELIHSTGHPTRLNRSTLTESEGFGSNPYCKEELIAEMGAAFLCGEAGLTESTLENSAAYIKGWLDQLQNDKKLIVSAAAQSQRAVDFILGRKMQQPDSRKE